MKQNTLQWVGHRGWPQHYPENSVIGLRAALEAGADAVEVDIQFSADAQPLLLHDTELGRIAGSDARVSSLSAAQLTQISVHEPERLGERYRPTPIAHLRDLVILMKEFSERQYFVELKCEVFNEISRREALRVLAQYLPESSPHSGAQFYLISFDLYVLRLAQILYGWPVGWVLNRFDALSLARVKDNPVDLVACDIRKIPSATERLWQGPWQWFLYDITQSAQRQACERWQVHWLETWDVGRMVAGELDE